MCKRHELISGISDDVLLGPDLSMRVITIDYGGGDINDSTTTAQAVP